MAEESYQDYRNTRVSAPPQDDPAPPPEDDHEELPASPDETPDAPEDDASTRNRRIENRFKRLTERLRTKDKEIADLQGQLTAVMQMAGHGAVEAPQEAPGGRPQREHYASDEEYFEALTDFKVDAALAKERQQQASTHAQAKALDVRTAYQAKLQDARAQHPDYDEVVEGAEVRIHDQVAAAILESEVGPLVVYHLAQHPEEAEALNDLGPVQLGRHLAGLEATVRPPAPEPPPPEPQPPPAPITPVAGSQAPRTPRNPDQLSYKDYREGRRSGRIR